MKRIIYNIYFTPRLAYALASFVLLFIVGYFVPLLFILGRFALFIFLGYCVFELYLLFQNSEGISATRVMPKKLSIGDPNEIQIYLMNRYDMKARVVVIDELPIQFQYRDSLWDIELPSKQERTLRYIVRPVKRGKYEFGAIVLLVSMRYHLFQRRYRFDRGEVAAVYPSYVHLRRYELMAFGNVRRGGQIVQNKKLGHGMEFEQIKKYVQGDPQRWINWKATGKHQSLMVNQYTDELSKDIWCFVDKGRLMKMPFHGLSLLDYAINATLAVSHIAIKGGDHVGLLTYSNKLSSIIMPSKRSMQMHSIMEALFNQRSRYMESNYELMTKYIKTKIRRRSLIFLFTNFETIHSFRRQLKSIKRLVTMHVVVVFFFENTEVTNAIHRKAHSAKEIFTKAVAEEVAHQKHIMVKELRAAGIIGLMVKPEELSLKVINNYLEIKSRGVV